MAFRDLSIEAAFGITMVVGAIVATAVLLYGSMGSSAVERAAEEVRVFFGTIEHGLPEDAWLRLHENTTRQLTLERFESLVETHPVFGTFESFEVDPDYSGDGSDISGELRVTGDAFRVVAIIEDRDDVANLVDLQVNGGSLFGVSAPPSGAVQN